MKSNKYYPKILIVGHYFNDKSGSGVTLTNLFKDWPQENIAIAANNIDIDYCIKFRPCTTYFDFNLKREKFDNNSISKNRRNSFVPSKIRNFLKENFGFLDITPDRRLSDNFLKFIDHYNPEIIYTALGSLREIKFINKLMGYRSIPLAIHIWDDWPNSLFNNRYFQFYWEYIYNKEFLKTLNISKVRMSICKSMSDEYKVIYNKTFIPFHNPVDCSVWENVPRIEKFSNESIIYIGKINNNTIAPIIDLCQAIGQLNKKGKTIIFDIYTPDYSQDNSKKINKYSNCHIYNSVSHNEIPQLLRSYSFVFLTLGFGKNDIKYTRLSMPTKLTEYLVSKTPILLYCPKEIALYEYSKIGRWAYWCDRGVVNLCDAINCLISDKNIQEFISNNAYATVMEFHTTEIVREKFRQTINTALDK